MKYGESTFDIPYLVIAVFTKYFCGKADET